MELSMAKRSETGKGAAKRMRKAGRIPAVVYKGGGPVESVTLDEKELKKALHSGERLLQLKLEGAVRPAVIKEVQFDELRDLILHVDFNEIALDAKLKIEVAVALKGVAVGVKEDHGVLDQQIHDLEVECLPTQIPENIPCDVSLLRIGDSIHVRDLVAPEGVKILADGELIVALVAHPKKEEELVAAAPVEGAVPAQPEVLTARKEEPEEGEEGAKAEKPEKGAKPEKAEKAEKAPKEKAPKEKGKGKE